MTGGRDGAPPLSSGLIADFFPARRSGCSGYTTSNDSAFAASARHPEPWLERIKTIVVDFCF
jgi:hypothetical protein